MQSGNIFFICASNCTDYSAHNAFMYSMCRFAVREKYPVDRGKERADAPSEEFLNEILLKAKPEESLKKILNPQFGATIALFKYFCDCSN